MRWRGTGAPEPVPDPVDVGLQARVDQVDAIVAAALRANKRLVSTDVLLDVKLALHPVQLRPEVPVIPGPDGARGA